MLKLGCKSCCIRCWRRWRFCLLARVDNELWPIPPQNCIFKDAKPLPACQSPPVWHYMFTRESQPNLFYATVTHIMYPSSHIHKKNGCISNHRGKLLLQFLHLRSGDFWGVNLWIPWVNLSSWLVVSTPLKNISQNGNLPQIGVKIKKCLKPPPSCEFPYNSLI